MTGYMVVITDPTRIYTDYAVVDLERQIIVCRSSCERDADRICDALIEQDQRRREAPKALLVEANT